MRAEPAQPIADSRRRRVLTGLAWCLVQVVFTVALAFAAAVAAGYLGLDVFSGQGLDSIVPAGLFGGAIAAMVVNHNARGWLQRARLRGLRVRGVAVEAKAGLLDYRYSPSSRGPGTARYTARVSWTDPVTGVRWKGERRYRFWGEESKGLEAALAYGAKVPVYYPPGRPSRFIIDIPFAPAMTDFFQ